MKDKLPHKIFVAGIGTGVGKTIASAILTEALHADYWKPIQCGNLEHSDTAEVQSLLSNKVSTVFAEQYKLKTPSSPHYAAKFEGVSIELDKFQFPESKSRLIIEGAGGLMVPLNNEALIIDFIAHYKLPVILIAQHYLGSINHTLLNIEALKQRGINMLGIIFNGRAFLDNEEIIAHFSNTKILGHISQADKVNKEFVQSEALKLKQSLTQYFEL